MPPVGFEPTISAGERPQTYVLDYADTGTGDAMFTIAKKGGFTLLVFPRQCLLVLLVKVRWR
jgi:hypothetical protein